MSTEKINDITVNYNNINYSLKGTYLKLNPIYNNLYNLSYITPTVSKNGSVLILLINDHFSEYSMIKYFGNKKDLTCSHVRITYKNMVSFFINLFLAKMYELTNININILYDNDAYICLLAQCVNIIRAGIKKYMRLRTADTQNICSKDRLNKHDRKTYGCALPIGPYDQCPTFSYLHNIKNKTCKNIIQSSTKTNSFANIGAKLLKGFHVKTKNIRNITLKKSIQQTRKRRNSPRQPPYYYEKEQLNTITPNYNVLPTIDIKNIPES